MAKKPMMLCILDGFGWVPDETYGNAIVAAKTPYLRCKTGKGRTDPHKAVSPPPSRGQHEGI